MVEPTSWLEWLARGGTFSFFVLATAGGAFHVGAAAIIVSFFRKRAGRILVVVTLGNSLLTVVVGYVGMVHGTALMEEAVAAVSPEHLQEIRRVGRAEAEIPFRLALVLGPLPMLMAGAGFAISSSRLAHGCHRH